MRIAFFTGPFPVYSETFVIRQIAGLRKRGHEVFVFPQEHGSYQAFHLNLLDDSFCPYVHYPPEMPEFPLRRILKAIKMIMSQRRRFLTPPWRHVIDPSNGGSYAKTLRLLFWAWPFLRAPRKFDAIVSHFETPANRVALLRRAGIIEGPHAAIFHTTFFLNEQNTSPALQRDVDLLKDLTFPSAEVVLPEHSRLAELMVENGAPEERVRVLHMGCGSPVQRFEPPVANLLFLSVCRLVEKKGLDDAIEALALVEAKIPSWEYHILGDGPLRIELEALVGKHGLSEKIHFHGATPAPQVADWMRRADVFLAPSKRAKSGDVEGIPVSVIEATSAGIPVVATAHEGIPECVVDGTTGFLVREGAPDELAGRIARLACDPDLRRRFSFEGVKHGLEQFNQASLDRELENLLLGLASNHREALISS